jgi:hypothetical protein
MADIDQIIAGGAGASSRADFSGLADIPEAYWKGKDRRYTQESRDLFKDGVPKNADGTIDYGAMRDALFKHGELAQGTTIDNLDLARQQAQIRAAAKPRASRTLSRADSHSPHRQPAIAQPLGITPPLRLH